VRQNEREVTVELFNKLSQFKEVRKLKEAFEQKQTLSRREFKILNSYANRALQLKAG
jgi:hypothetical protein